MITDKVKDDFHGGPAWDYFCSKRKDDEINVFLPSTSNPISLPQQQLGAIEKVTNVKTDVKSVIGKSNTCV